MEKLGNSNDPTLCKKLNGWTWGKMDLKETSLKMISKDKEWFSIPGNLISNLRSVINNSTNLWGRDKGNVLPFFLKALAEIVPNLQFLKM